MVRNEPYFITEEDYDDDAVVQTNLFKVPVAQRSANPQAYSPYLFSFGPYHALVSTAAPPQSARANLRDGDHFKQKVAEALLEDEGLDQLKEKIMRQESGIRTQYVQMSRSLHPGLARADAFASLLALDGVTMVAATLRKRTLLIHPVARTVLNDAILLENQVPIIVMKCAVESLNVDADRRISLEKVVEWYLDRASPFPRAYPFLLGEGHMGEPLLSFIYDLVTSSGSRWESLYLLPVPSISESDRLPSINIPTQDEPAITPHSGSSRSPSTNIPIQDNPTSPSPLEDGGNSSREHPLLESSSIDSRPSLPTASQLQRCGFTFAHNDSANVNGIRLDSGNGITLSMPTITVSDTTVRVLHNLLAYEATSRFPRQYSLVSYVHFMDCLINTADDVRVLVDAGIINNSLGSDEELASMWNKLCKSVSCGIDPRHGEIMANAEKLSKVKWRKWKASFKEEYWERQPWLLFSILAAMILFVLSLLQTIFTILAY